MAYYGDSKVVDVKGFDADPAGDVGAAASSEEDFADPVQAKPKRNWRSYIWDSLDKSPEERRLLLKLDCALLTFGCLGKVNLVVLQPSNAVERIFYQIS